MPAEGTKNWKTIYMRAFMYRRCTDAEAWEVWFRRAVCPELEVTPRRDQMQLIRKRAAARVADTGRFDAHIRVKRWSGGWKQAFELVLLELSDRTLHRFLLVGFDDEDGRWVVEEGLEEDGPAGDGPAGGILRAWVNIAINDPDF